ncbi:LytR/AlgR family response regulator transcription factor [Saccharicrinis sp. FJH62]|uniref:LytR/AlgR family response regulator transcription factor n=1 Tax=Saccharicrinis sp. FJH62 TaxID=3344657 RepID=UPI0035D52A8A
MIHCVIIDDEVRGRENLVTLVKLHCPEISVTGTADGVSDGFELLNQTKPQLLFLDIEMKDGTGFDLLAKFKNPAFEVIFVTAFDHYGLNAVKFSAVDYILKPIESNQLVKAVEKAKQRIKLKEENIRLQNLLHNISQPDRNKRIALPFVDHIDFVEVKHIIRLEADGSYTRFITTTSKELMVSGSLKEFDEILSVHGFIRTHQAHLINPEFVKTLIKSDGGYLIMMNGDNVPVSRLRKTDVIQSLKG